MSGHGEQIDPDDQGGIQAGSPRQRPGAQGAFLTRHGDGMAGNGSTHDAVKRPDGLRVPSAALLRRKVSMRLSPDRDGARPTEQGEGKAGPSQKHPRLCFTGPQKSMRSMESRPEHHTRQTEAAAAWAAALAAQQSLVLQVA